MDYSSGKIEASGEALQSSDTNTSSAALLPQSGNSLSHMAADVQEDTDMVAGDKQHDSLDLPTPPSVSSCVSTSWGGFEFTELQAVLKDMEKQMETNGTRMFCNEQEADDSASENENEDEDTQQTELNLRDYQQELAEPALLGHNVLICASTGTGKTEVAIKVAMQHLSKQSDQQRVRVAFLVKTQALARQQYQRFRKYYSPSRVKLLVGGGNAPNPIELSAVLGDFDVFVMTAGIFRNALEKGATPVRFDDFRLIIFDEAHSAMKGTDYALILRMYVKRKKELLLLSTNSNSSATAQSTAMDTLPSTANSTVLVSDEKPTSKHDNEVGANPVENRLPQIIGLTASPGTEKASNLNDALDHILQLCAMLDAKVSIVRRSKATLADYTNRTASRHVPCSTRQPDRFRALVEEEMALISQKINQLLQKHVKRVENDLGYLPAAPERAEFGTISYSSKIGALRKKIRKISKPELTRDLQICTDWLRIYNIGLVLNSAVLHRHAVTYIKEQVVLRRYANLHANGQEDALGGQSRPDVKCQIIFRFICLIDKLQRLAIIETSVQSEVADLIASLPLPPRFIVSSVGDADSCTGVNDKLQKLKDEVLGLLRRKSDSRVLIFVQERYASMALLDWFSKDADLARLNPVRLSGQAKTSAGGLTSSAAKANLERFASGNSKVMITTSVAEEGVDIPQCNLVIRFQYVKDEVGLVQVRGRCRSKESDCVLIYDSANEALALKDKENEIRNDLMEKAIEELCAMDEETFKKRVAKHQAEIFPAESASASAENPTSLQSMDSGIGDDRAWQVLCGYCQALVAHHTRILRACGSHHIVVDENVYDRVCARLLAKPRSVGDTELIGDCMCKNCWSKKVDEKKLGKIIRIGSDQKRLFALLSAEDICFRAPGSEKIIIFKKWKDAKDNFEIRDANNEDLNAFLERTKDRKFLPLDAPGK